ncbi:MAG: hypothetical protein JWR20_2831 [Marmoricola sp.]|nr:hypothetical protein [Marmoricola sp.]
MELSSPVATRVPGAAPRTTSPVTTVVASVPSSHVYVRHVADEQPVAAHRVVRLPDPHPDDPSRPAEDRWWPPAMLDPGWVGAHDFDVMHVQFGFDSWTPERLEEVARAVHARGSALVHTVHDLRNPHHPTRELHDAQLAVLLRHADAVLTLTPGAAEETARRFGRRPEVVPHPHVVELDTMERFTREPRPEGPFRVGLHVKSLRANADPVALLPTLVRTTRALGGVLQVNGHRDALLPGGARYDAALSRTLHEAHDAGDLELVVHDFFTDAQLWDYLRSLDVSVLPYRFGTHSGWLEACRDLGTAVLAPTCGHHADQGPVHPFVLDEDDFVAASLESALHDAHDAGRPDPLGVAERREQRAGIAAAHRRVYASVTGAAEVAC